MYPAYKGSYIPVLYIYINVIKHIYSDRGHICNMQNNNTYITIHAFDIIKATSNYKIWTEHFKTDHHSSLYMYIDKIVFKLSIIMCFLCNLKYFNYKGPTLYFSLLPLSVQYFYIFLKYSRCGYYRTLKVK
jgi:hypothetical protein